MPVGLTYILSGPRLRPAFLSLIISHGVRILYQNSLYASYYHRYFLSTRPTTSSKRSYCFFTLHPLSTTARMSTLLLLQSPFLCTTLCVAGSKPSMNASATMFFTSGHVCMVLPSPSSPKRWNCMARLVGAGYGVRMRLFAASPRLIILSLAWLDTS